MVHSVAVVTLSLVRCARRLRSGAGSTPTSTSTVQTLHASSGHADIAEERHGQWVRLVDRRSRRRAVRIICVVGVVLLLAGVTSVIALILMSQAVVPGDPAWTLWAPEPSSSPPSPSPTSANPEALPSQPARAPNRVQREERCGSPPEWAVTRHFERHVIVPKDEHAAYELRMCYELRWRDF